jgi:hypothetical protein
MNLRIMACIISLMFSQTSQATPCQTTREFITALEFLRSDNDFKPPEAEARDLALKVAEGCSGSARRFIRVAKALSSAGSTRKDATRIALKFSTGSDAETDAFSSVFRKSIAEDSLDLDLDSALKIALSLSKGFPGNLAKVREDFEKLVDYCSNGTNLGLPRAQCGSFASRIVSASEKWEDGVALPFIKSFEYLKSEEGPALVMLDALRLAEDLSKQGPIVHENFTQAYQFAMSSTGLGYTREEAIKFARKMSKIGEPKKSLERKSSH